MFFDVCSHWFGFWVHENPVIRFELAQRDYSFYIAIAISVRSIADVLVLLSS